MGTAIGSFVNSSSTFEIRLESDLISNRSFEILGDVVLQTGNQTRVLDDAFKPVLPTQFRFEVRSTTDLLDILQTADPRSVIVRLIETSDSNREWFKGYIQKETLENNEYWTADSFMISCFDGLSILENIDYDLEGKLTVAEFIQSCLVKTGTASKAIFISDWQDTRMPNTSPANMRIQAEDISASSYYDALEMIVERFGMILSMESVNGEAKWYIVKRKVIGQDLNGWEIDISDASVSSYTVDDLRAITDDDIVAEHVSGKMQSVNKIESKFTWPIEPPFFNNSSFQQWNEELTKPLFWDIVTGSIERTEFSQDDTFMATSTDAVIRQKGRYVKMANRSFTIKLSLINVANDNNPDISPLREFVLGSVRFIDPNGLEPDRYLTNLSTTTETLTNLTYSAGPVKSQSYDEINISLGLSRYDKVFSENWIAEFTFGFETDDTSGETRWESVSIRELSGDVQIKAMPDTLSTFYDDGDRFTTATKEFSISTQANYNAVGQIETLDVFWGIAGLWDGLSMDVRYVSEYNAQTKLPASYYKIKLTPSAFKLAQTNYAISYSSKLFSIVYRVISFVSSSSTIQIVEKENELPGLITQRYDLSSEDGLDFGTTTVDPVEVVDILEVVGDVDVINIGDTDILVEWANIEVLFENENDPLAITDGSYNWEVKERNSQSIQPVIFYLDKNDNQIKTSPLDEWLLSTQLRRPSVFPELWRVTQNTNVEGLDLPGPPDLFFKSKPYTSDLLYAVEADQNASIQEVIGGNRAKPLFAIGLDYEDDTNALASDPKLRPRVNIPEGTHLMIVVGNKEPVYVTTTENVQAGSLIIPIEFTYVKAFKGAKVFFDDAFIGGQFLVRPSQVLIQAQSAAFDANSALILTANNGEAISSLGSEVLGPNGLGNSAGIKFEVNQTKATAVVKVNSQGRLAFVRIDAEADSETEININADQVTVTAENTTFLNSMSQLIFDGDLPIPDGNVSIVAATKPELRKDNTPLKDGDLWYDSSNGNLPYVYEVDDFVRNYVNINGGDLEAGTVDFNKMNVEDGFIDDLFSENIIVRGKLSAIEEGRPNNRVEMTSNGIEGYLDGQLRFNVPVVGTPLFTGEIKETIVQLETTELRTNDAIQTEGGVGINNAGIIGYNGVDPQPTFNLPITGSPFFKGQIVAESGSLVDLDLTGDLTFNGGKVLFPQINSIGNTPTQYNQMLLTASGLTYNFPISDTEYNTISVGSNVNTSSDQGNVLMQGNIVQLTNLPLGNPDDFGQSTVAINGRTITFIKSSGGSFSIGINANSKLETDGTEVVDDGTYSNPTSITVVNGYITDIQTS